MHVWLNPNVACSLGQLSPQGPKLNCATHVCKSASSWSVGQLARTVIPSVDSPGEQLSALLLIEERATP